ncbi:hypothetical protein RvY_05222 [Ramazzottius varieornatus]|uniref:Uncharacterized protein n=1 Tax=Ramazzottius varieornatus TaxID=947166 RepID=A0A1D1UUA7_RAMVA|nr:hypothetical protein RvY_05222 [Ramazzottius varieornatus]
MMRKKSRHECGLSPRRKNKLRRKMGTDKAVWPRRKAQKTYLILLVLDRPKRAICRLKTKNEARRYLYQRYYLQ